MQNEQTLKLTVHYPPAEKPFKDDDASRSETVGQLKTRVLAAFGLTEGQTPEGNIVTYTLYHEKQPLDNLTQTLGDIAGHQKVLQLKLSQQLIQG